MKILLFFRLRRRSLSGEVTRERDEGTGIFLNCVRSVLCWIKLLYMLLFCSNAFFSVSQEKCLFVA